ncbi:MAG TPA: enolase C-terminal domain-like protein [Balneolaceae bacterium]|nr:enolase C-terminal domain-like protein [Balneolaceae bacterium]
MVLKDIEVSAFNIPTEEPESDGTLEWESTTLVLVEATAGDKKGIGYTYAHQSAASLIITLLKPKITGLDCMDIPSIWLAMQQAIRNQGNCGIAYMALSAVDSALWDLKAKHLSLPLAKVIGMAREEIPVYGSGGFTSYSIEKLQNQFANWVDEGIYQVKMKVGRHPTDDVKRVKAAREAIGKDIALFVDANGAYSEKQAITKAHQFAEAGVSWFEEPVSSDNLSGLQFIKNKVPAIVEIAAGEYGYHLSYFKRMLEAQAVDVLQADATRCGGITGFLRAANLSRAFMLPLSSHCAPSLHLHAALAFAHFRHAEYFYDHVRIENMLFDGAQRPKDGVLTPDLTRPGLGLEFKHKDAEKYKI